MISVCMLVKNGEKTIGKSLDSVAHFPEVVLLDTGSTDKTLEIAREYPNVKVHHSPFSGFGQLRNDLSLLSSHDWIFALDSDEIVSPALATEIFATPLNPSVAYSMPRHNFYQGKRIRGCGWGGDVVTRLYHRKFARFSTASVHESLEASQKQPLKGPLLHTPYLSTTDFLRKMDHYSTLFAEQYQHKKTSSFRKALSHAAFSFFRSYLLKGGLFDGREGFTISLYNANTAFYKYLKLSEINKHPLQ